MDARERRNPIYYVSQLMIAINWKNVQCTLLLFVDFLYTGRRHGPPFGMPGRTQGHCVTVVDVWSGCQCTHQGLFHVVSCD